MKPNRDASELAARLSQAASKPLPLPAAPADVSMIPRGERQVAPRGRPATDTVGMTLRPTRALLTRYTLAAAERTRAAGRVVSAQEIMLEQLERGP